MSDWDICVAEPGVNTWEVEREVAGDFELEE